MPNFNDTLVKYKQILEQNAPENDQPDAAQPQSDITADNVQDIANLASGELESGKKTLLVILINVTEVLKSLLIGTANKNTEEITAVDELLDKTRTAIASGEDLNELLKQFLSEFQTAFSRRLQ